MNLQADGDSSPAGVAYPQRAAAMPRRLRSSAPPLDNDDILEEILLRLPPLPSSLPRASLVSKRWRRLVSDPRFVRRFRAHHRTPPLLGFYVGATFVPALDPPDRVPAARFSLGPQGDEAAALRKEWTCCQGLLLGLDVYGAGELQVFDPMSGHRSRVPFPAYYQSDSDMRCITAAAIPHAGSGDRRLFRIVTLFRESWPGGAFASVYSSESGEWEDRVAAHPNPNDPHSSPTMQIVRPGNIVGNAIYWTLTLDQGILEFDLDSQSLTVIELPPDAHVSHGFKCQIMPTEGGQLGLAVVVKSSIQFWEKEINRGRGPTARWLLRKTIQSDSFCPQVFPQLMIVGFAEESKVIFLTTDESGVFMVHLDTMKSRKVLRELRPFQVCPYSSF